MNRRRLEEIARSPRGTGCVRPRDNGHLPTDRDEISMAHTTPIQEKLTIDDSSAHKIPAETLAEGSGNATRGEFDTLPFSFWSSS